MNGLPDDSALKDRIFCIEVPGYTTDEKTEIIIDYLLPKHMKNIGINPGDIKIDKSVAKYLINKVDTPENKGVREIERCVKDILNKIYFLQSNNVDEFSLSFQTKEKITFPLKITKELVDNFCKTYDTETGSSGYSHLYI